MLNQIAYPAEVSHLVFETQQQTDHFSHAPTGCNDYLYWAIVPDYLEHVLIWLNMAAISREGSRNAVNHLHSHDAGQGVLEWVTLGQLHGVSLCAISIDNVG